MMPPSQNSEENQGSGERLRSAREAAGLGLAEVATRLKVPMHIVEAARMGADICTCPPAVIDSLFNHPLTDIGLKKFLADWEKAQAAATR